MAETHSRTAPFYQIPNRPIVCVEHPAIIKNIDKAIDTLQGRTGIKKILDPPKPDTPASLVLRPEDVMARPLQSISTASNNILLRVTVPKRTGRKRKRGSNEPFKDDPDLVRQEDGPPRPTARDFLRSLRDNVGMPDFVFSTTNSPFVSRFREKILPFNFKQMKEFDLDMSKGAISNVDILPPPSFSHGDIPFHYFYRQNPTVRQTLDKAGNLTTVNTQQSAKVLTHLVPYDIEVVPAAPRADLPAIDTLDPVLRETINIVLSLFATRPAWSRRALRNNLTSLEQRYALRHAVPYAGYIFRSGPWRDAIIAFGHDPRKDPSSRIYQTTMFRILPGTSETARDRDPRDRDSSGGRRHTLLPRPNEMTINPEVATSKTSHLFTGQPPLPLDGRMWMFCDITDPLLQGILNPPNDSGTDQPPPGFLRDECDIATDGWYGNGTMAKMKTIMRHKILAMYEGRTPAKDEEYAPILSFPDHASPETGLRGFWLDPEFATSMATALATEVRSMIKAAPAWREMATARTLAKKGDSAKVQGAKGADEEEEDEEGIEGEGEAADESEGEEEAIEQAEIMEAAAEAVHAAAKRDEEDEIENDIDEVDEENEMD
ncbi:hypothetical protein AN7997.2 [Aspergillus nidulans FGSC A4]|uniref:RNA polymerase III transcription factor subunit, putative (AFU_orthologue AFUA_5G02550) n=1 Tax=Emericella nidulans (strain FGSC A4 / ATCC 38163 / CBS 112.46 / NRRL 194 / M139) TaxID=227321 RepID=Q5AUN3_EMENI|nr:transcription factor TFIIIC subunit TFC1 [Aspergillus nidulans FGSC A4]EAA58800.1 hypothetical protein AN7997.2 [Aspergillus nidulans FGSC A4]CBF73674.1 TPA: RNA polymerase III transcription factor subunit, putative (AFU_orthologue; AFUA_5G02550) [Aspergillus nidulans FGSC A4]|eukprot:XP_681266.1 hypothetical protein AN7997.2 [Aspergillus nidulans FGSC A4]